MGKSILCIDDDEELLRSLKVCLESGGYRVTTASDGKEGLLKLKTDSPDLLVLDVIMDTNFEGYNLLNLIKEQPEHKNLPVIMLTGMTDKLGVNISSGFQNIAFLPNVHIHDKPIDPSDLLKLINELLNK